MILLSLGFGVAVSGGLVGYIESLLLREVVDAFAPTLLQSLDTLAAAPSAEGAPALAVLLWGAGTAIELRAIIWWIIGCFQAVLIAGALKAKIGI